MDNFLKSLLRRAAGGVPLFITNGGLMSSSPSGGVGYYAGAGGIVTQITNKATAVTLNRQFGQITLNNAALNLTTSVSFTLNNTSIAAVDQVSAWIVSGATAGSYFVTVDAVAANSCVITLRNYSGGSLSEAVVIGFAVWNGAIT